MAGNRSAAVKKAWITRRGGGKGGGGWGVVGPRKVGLPGDLVGRKTSFIPGDLVPDKRIKSYADVHAATVKAWETRGASHAKWKDVAPRSKGALYDRFQKAFRRLKKSK